MKVLLFGTTFSGLTRRASCALRAAGHQVSVELVGTVPSVIESGVELAKPDLVLCVLPVTNQLPAGRSSGAASPTALPPRVWRDWRTVTLRVGPVDAPGSPSDHEPRAGDARTWIVTAREVVSDAGARLGQGQPSDDVPDHAGPLLASRTLVVPSGRVRRSELYRGVIADAVLDCLAEVTRKASDPTFVAVPGEPEPPALPRFTATSSDPGFRWDRPASEILDEIRDADGSPGVPARLLGQPILGYDAGLGVDPSGEPITGPPGAVIGRHETSVLVGTGDGSVWIGHMRLRPPGSEPGIKLPSAVVLRGSLRGVPVLRNGPPPWLTYRRTAAVGTLTFRPYNGALSSRQCRRLLVALRYALAQQTSVVVIRGGEEFFCTGAHLGLIEAAPDPAAEAWGTVRALNAVCRRLCALSIQLVITAFTGDAAAGGAMLGLGADVVVAREGIVLNPFFDLGLHGSQLHTYSLPLRVGEEETERLLAERLPVDTRQALGIGLVDEVGPRDPREFSRWLAERAANLAAGGPSARSAADRRSARSDAAARRAALPRRPLAYYETAEMAEVARDIFDDRNGFAARRRAFLRRRDR